MALKELSSLERFLGLKKPNKYSTQGNSQVPVLQGRSGPIVGLLTVCSHLVSDAQRPELLGGDAQQRAEVRQWLEYRVTRVDGCPRDEAKSVLTDLNLYLRDKVYLVANRLSLADALLYYGLHPLVVDLAVQEKERYMNVTRWFDHLQHLPGLRHHLPPVVVLRNRVYPGGPR